MMLFLVWALNCVYQDLKNSYEIFAEQFYQWHRGTYIKVSKNWSKELRYNTSTPHRHI